MKIVRKLLVGVLSVCSPLFLLTPVTRATSGLGVVSSTLHVQNRIVVVWVQVTRPMLACESLDDSPELRERLLYSYPLWREGRAVPEGCGVLKLGDRFVLDHEQTDVDTKIIVKMWRPVCPRGCVPSATPVYAPSRDVAGDYLRPIAPPKGW